MADITFACPHCQATLEAPDDVVGQVIECPECNQNFEVPAAAPEAAATPARVCVKCGEAIETDAVICIACGTNQKTGKTLQTELGVEKPPAAPKSNPPPKKK